MDESSSASVLQLVGAACFGALIGWFVYFVNRHREGSIGLGDLAALVGVIGGAGILALFPAGTDLFGAFGVGLFLGFFAYLVVLVVLVRRSNNFTWDWFIDGRSASGEERGGRAMGHEPDAVAPVRAVDPASDQVPGAGPMSETTTQP